MKTSMTGVIAGLVVITSASAALAAPDVPSGSVDIGPLIQAVAHSVGVVVLSTLAWWVKGHMQDQAARDTVLTAAENGVSYAVNRVDGAVAGQALTVPVGSNVAAMALRYVIEQVPDAAKRLGLDEQGIAKIVVAKLPGVNGQIDDATLNGVVASATGKAPSGADLNQLAGVLGPMVEQAVKDVLTQHYAGKPAQPAAT